MIIRRWIGSWVFVLFGAAALSFCGSDSNSPTPPGPPSIGAAGCSPAPESALATGSASPSSAAGPRAAGRVLKGEPPPSFPPDKRGGAYEELWKHRAGLAQGLVRPLVAPAIAEDVGQIAVIRDQGDVLLRANPFDLRSTSLRFTRNGSGGYNVSRGDRTFTNSIGDQIALEDDDSREVSMPFAFQFYGQRFSSGFINSDGNMTFEAGDNASTERDVSRFLTGPPRIALLFDDLDPSAGGGVYMRSSADTLLVTWCNVPEFGSTRRVNVQVLLNAAGTIEMVFGDPVTATTAVVGLSPGRTGIFEPLDLSRSGTLAGGTGAVGERFSSNPELDLVAVTRKFYESHADVFDQLVFWANVRTTAHAFAFERTVANETGGIGVPVFDSSRDFGSAGRLRSLVNMDMLGKYPEDPNQRVLGENSTLSVMGQEVGHRWLAFLQFRDGSENSKALLGRDSSHWSFFFDSDASVMEGNDIEDIGAGVFRTVGTVSRYSALDQYAMGLREASEVPPFFFVANATADAQADSSPRTGVEIRGTRRDVSIQDVIAVLGPRTPGAASSPKTIRQAFVFVANQGTQPQPSEFDKLERIRSAWEHFYERATDGRGSAIARLR